MDVTVLESNSGGFVLSWELGETIVDAGAISFPDEDLLAEFLELAQIRFEYTTDPAGAYLGLRNLDEVRDRLGQAIDLLAELPGMDPGVLEETRAVALSDQALQAGAAQDIVVYHSLYGRSLDVARPEVEATLLTNLFGGEPFPATKTTKVITTRDNQGCVVVEVTETPDPERFVEILFDTLFPVGSEPSAEDRAEVESFQIVNKALFVYDYGSGRIRHVTAEQTTSTVSAFRTDVVTIVETNR